MKLFKILLAVSLLANAALVIAFVVGATGDSPAIAAESSTSATVSRPALTNKAGVDPEMWRKLSGDDLPALVAGLRGKGFPPAVVRAILSAQIGESFRARRKALEPTAAADTPFWKNPVRDAQTMAALRDLSREQQKMMKSLFGTDPNADDPLSAANDERRYGPVPPEKRDQIKQIVQEFNDLRNDIYERARGSGNGPTTLLPDEQAKINQLEQAQHAALAKVLTPQELEDYDLRNSNTAENLRYNLTAFNATEDEFRALYRLQAAFDDKFGRLYSTPTQEEQRLRSAGQTELQKQIEATLGPDRFAEYQRASDYNYRQTAQLVSRLELPPETAAQLYALQKDMQQRQQAIGMDRTLQMADRMQQMTALAEEARAKVNAALGPRGAAAYPTNGGQWLQNLAPRPPTAPRPAIGGGG